MSMYQVLSTTKAPAAIGPYSQAVKTGGMIFVSGQLPIDPESGIMVAGAGEQTRRSLLNLEAILSAAGASLSDVVKTTVFLGDMDDFAAMNKVYAEFFTSTPPARATVEVSRLPRDAKVEIEAIAIHS